MIEPHNIRSRDDSNFFSNQEDHCHHQKPHKDVRSSHNLQWLHELRVAVFCSSLTFRKINIVCLYVTFVFLNILGGNEYLEQW